ncbi:MAG: hypothetical protein HQL40_19860 [Alphaproteobacteria bacterium]|nr:hypothetical protein [Alphaproteobacteria bacterium]
MGGDAAEVGGPAIARTRLAERARWRETGASPFGIALRGDQPAPFATWDYAPPYLPAGMTIPVALASDDPRHPFVFVSPGTSRPDQWTDGRAGARQTAAGLRMIEGVALDGPLAVDLSGAGIVTRDADRPRMVLTLSRADGGPPRRLSLPDLEWID